MAFVPKKDVTCRIYYVGFPAKWKERLVKIQRMNNPKYNEAYALPTYALKNSLTAWMDGVVEIGPLRKESKDEKWMISCEKEIDTELVLEHIKMWLSAEYLMKARVLPKVKDEVQKLIGEMQKEELDALKGSEEAALLDEEGIPAENYSFAAFGLLAAGRLMGKTIRIDGHDVKFYYAGKGQLISEIQGEGDKCYSYGILFSMQTIPPKRKPLLLCECRIHRWIPGKWKDTPYLKESILACVWVGKEKIYQLPLEYDKTKRYRWRETEQAYYNLYASQPLPEAENVIENIEGCLQGQKRISLFYKNGMNSNGFQENKIGTGVSVREKKEIFQEIFGYLKDLVEEMPEVQRLKTARTGRASMSLPVDTINFNKELKEEEKQFTAERMRECLGRNALKFEVYYQDSAKECAEQIAERMQEVFADTEKMKFEIELCQLGSMGDAMESSRKEAALKRIKEIEKMLDSPKECTPCIVLLPDKDKFAEGDPKGAIRCGFAMKNRLTQFITPWDAEQLGEAEEKQKSAVQKTIESKINSAIQDLCRQLGYIRGLLPKAAEDEKKLVHTNVIGMQIMTQVCTIYGKARFLPLFVEMNYSSGKVFVECGAFEHPRVSYQEAAFELARLSLDKKFGEKCDGAVRGMLKQKMMMWKNLYKEENLLVLVEADGNTRALCHGITDSQIQKYDYLEAYRPKKIEVGTKENSYLLDLNESGVRLVRIRRNREVPDYYTDDSQKHENAQMAASGLFRYQGDYWAIAAKPGDKSYTKSYTETKYSLPNQKFAERDMIEIYPIQLQKGDNPDEWAAFTNSLRKGAIQYNEATAVPIPLHLAAKLQEYLLSEGNGFERV